MQGGLAAYRNTGLAGARQAHGVMFALAANFLFSASDTIVKLLSAHYSVFQIIAMQAAVAGLVAGIVLARGGVSLAGIRHPWLVVTRGFLAGVGTVSGFYAFSRLPLAEVYSITFCTPLVVTIASVPMLGERVGIRRWMAVLAGLIGVLVMVRPGVTPLSSGHLAAFLCVFVSAAVVIIMRSIAAHENRGILVGAVIAGQLVASLPGAALAVEVPAPGEVGLVVIAGLLVAVAQFLMLESLRLAPAASVAPMQYSKLVWGLIAGVLLFGDWPRSHVLLGAAIVIASVLYIFHRERRVKAA